jgi:hypothetical protein
MCVSPTTIVISHKFPSHESFQNVFKSSSREDTGKLIEKKFVTVAKGKVFSISIKT